MDNKKVEVRKSKTGKGIFAKQKIAKGEEVATFDGAVHGWNSKFWGDGYDVFDHAIQFEERMWRDSNGIARLLNHSCDPNCGIKNLFTLVTMRDIQPNEELTWDYEMTEDAPIWHGSRWSLECKCGAKNCRKLIGRFANMPEHVRKKYKGYISDWLVKKYNLNYSL